MFTQFCKRFTLTVQIKLNLGINFLIKGDRAFILLMSIPCDKTFLSVHKILISWPLPLLLTYFWKNLTYDITFESKEIRLSYHGYSLVTSPFCRYLNFWSRDLDLQLWPVFEKKINLGINFWSERDRAFIKCMCIPCGKTFLSVLNFYPVTLTSGLELLLKKLNLCINFWTKRDPKRLQKLGRVVLVPLGQPLFSL